MNGLNYHLNIDYLTKSSSPLPIICNFNTIQIKRLSFLSKSILFLLKDTLFSGNGRYQNSEIAKIQKSFYIPHGPFLLPYPTDVQVQLILHLKHLDSFPGSLSPKLFFLIRSYIISHLAQFNSLLSAFPTSNLYPFQFILPTTT